MAPITAIGSLVESIGKGLDALVSFFKDFWDGLVEFIKSIFIPSDDFWDSKVGGLQDTLESKLGADGYKQVMESMANVNSGAVPNTQITLLGATFSIFDFDLFNQYKGYIHTFFYAVFAVLLLRYHINNIHRLTSGNDLYDGGGDI